MFRVPTVSRHFTILFCSTIFCSFFSSLPFDHWLGAEIVYYLHISLYNLTMHVVHPQYVFVARMNALAQFMS